MLVGAVLGGLYQYELIKRLTFIADLTPVQILAIFLPILIFESAFSCDPHIFIKSLGQILTLAIFGTKNVHASISTPSASHRFRHLGGADNPGRDVLVRERAHHRRAGLLDMGSSGALLSGGLSHRSRVRR